MSSVVKKSDLDLKNKKLSKKCLFEKLENHIKKLVEEIEEKTSDFQKSFQSLQASMDVCLARGPCESMQNYFERIQELNKHFDDLEDKSSNFVDNISRLRIKSLLIDGLKELDDGHDSSPITEAPQLQLNANNSSVGLFRDNILEIDDSEAMKIIINENEDIIVDKVPEKEILSELEETRSYIEEDGINTLDSVTPDYTHERDSNCNCCVTPLFSDRELSPIAVTKIKRSSSQTPVSLINDIQQEWSEKSTEERGNKKEERICKKTSKINSSNSSNENPPLRKFFSKPLEKNNRFFLSKYWIESESDSD
ncbi:hypothetical protein KQX54_016770 [Cotesia glomerata]|uniref:Uncharacterized protein n=1 Tax=Cotesia glomerata TaxID=32391 RepID=A0AAV7IA13_COTGL|nr:hypothetical protein KQX54_016770 [Cotesia glomerata]